MTAARIAKDSRLQRKIEKKKKKHLGEAKSVFDFQQTYRTRAKNYANVHAFVIDNMASKNIPKFRKEKADAWSKDKLTIHLGGSYCYKEDTIEYLLYPELVSESSNTILTQIDSLLRKLAEKKAKLHEIVFVFDNHSTQKNAYVLSYFEWQAKRGFISKEGTNTTLQCLIVTDFFLLIFLVRGHTHNILDAANQKVSQQYYSAESITSCNQMVCPVYYRY